VVSVFRAGELDAGTAARLVAGRIAAITHAPPGVDTLDTGSVEVPPGAAQPAHHHGPRECLMGVLSGELCVRWGEDLAQDTRAGPGDWVRIPPWLPHRELNASPHLSLRYLLVRDAEDPVMVLLDLPGSGGGAPWVDGHHPPAS